MCFYSPIVGPKRTLKKKFVNGKTVNIPLPFGVRSSCMETPWDSLTMTVVVAKCLSAGSVVMTRTA